jgi:mannosyltransferase
LMAEAGSTQRGRGWRRVVPLNVRGDIVLGLVVVVLTLVGAAHVSPWLDEAATANIVSYPTWDMTQLWTASRWWPKGVDVALAPYYLVVHQWVRLVGISPLTLRLPSVIAAGVGTAVMAAVGRRLVGRRRQLAYATCYGLLPRTTAMAIEARPYALSSMFMAAALLFVVMARRKLAWWGWLLLVMSMVGAVAMQLYAAFPIAGLVVASWFFLKGRARWLVTIAAAFSAAILSPFLWLSYQQIGQSSWLADQKFSLANRFLVESWATSRVNAAPTVTDLTPGRVALAMAVIAGLLIVLVIVASRGRGLARLGIASIPLVLSVGTMWILALTSMPVFASRYLSSAAPFFAMVLAEAVLLARWRAAKVLVVLLAVGALVLYGFQQRPFSKSPIDDYGLMPSVVRQHGRAGDGYLVDPLDGLIGSYRAAIVTDPGAYKGMADLAAPERLPLDYPWAHDPPAVDLATLPNLPNRIWVGAWNQGGSLYGEQLAALGYHVGYSKRGPAQGNTIFLWER